MTISTRAVRAAILGTAALWLAACASTEGQPADALAQAETVIRQAEQSGAAEHSARELRLARDKLQQAREAVQAEDFALAQRLAREASADAEFAAALARSSKAEAAAEEIEATIATLRSEAARQ